MAIVTDQTITIHGVSVGISKPIQTLIANGDFTYDELSKFAFVGRYDFVNDACAVYDNANNEYGQSAQLLTLDKYPILNDPSKPWDTIWYQYHGSVGRTAATYGKMILIYDFNDARDSIKNNFTDDNTACVVTELNPRLLKMSPNVTLSTITASLGEPGTYTTYDVETTINISWFDDDSASPFRPLCVSKIEDHEYFYFPLYNNTLSARQNISGNTDGTYAQLINLQDSFDNGGDSFLSPWASSSPILDFCPGHDYGTTFIGAYTLNTGRADRLLILDYHGAWDFNGNLQVKASSLDAALKQCAACGLYFEVNGITYKPLTSGGIVTGYTTELDKNGEWDLINDVTGNTIPDTPDGGGGGGDEDDFDDHSMGAGTGISGMANLWLLTASQLSDLHSSCNSAPVGFDPLNSFISVMGLGINPELITHEIEYISPINIRMSNGTTWHTHVEGHIVTGQVSAFQFTGIKVERRFNNFLDFSPYAVHEIFLPCCGWITLPDIAVNRTITVTYLPDIESLKCRAVVSVVDNSGRRCVVGEKDGILGADVPFTNTGHSLFVGDAIVNGADIAGEAITMAIGANYTKKNTKGGAFRPYEGFTLGGAGTLPGAIGNAFVSGNLNRTHYLTGNGTRVGFSDGENIQIKSTYHEVDIPKNYAHTVGLMCNKTDELSNFTGFTVCDNPHITFSALEAEKEEIKRLLEEGVIL